MSVHVECGECGAVVSTAFGRVFGDGNDTPHACLSCSTTSAIQRGAAGSPAHDGTPLVHRPGYDDPQPVVTDHSPDAPADHDPIYLEEVRDREPARTNEGGEDGFTHSDDAFEALVAE